VRAAVECDDRGRPVQLCLGDDPTPRAIATLVEEWRLDDEWWRDPVARRYVEVVLCNGKHLVLFEDLLDGAWYVQTP
jgi:hypothetical protein